MKLATSALIVILILFVKAGWAQNNSADQNKVQFNGSSVDSTSAPVDPGFSVENNPLQPNPMASDNQLIESQNLGLGLSGRDPFSLPEYILIKIRKKESESAAGSIDESAPPIIRWPLGQYQLVGIIWDVNKPKAMFLDNSKKVHIVKVNDFIGNMRGVITQIKAGSVTVKEGQIPQVIKLNK